MNVLVWNSWVAHPVGGMERVALELALQLHRRGHRVSLAGAYDNAPELRRQIPADMPYYPFDIHRPRFKPHLKAARLLSRVMREKNIQVVSAHGSIFALHEVCRCRHTPMIWTVHGAGPRPGGMIERMKTAALSRVLASANTHAVAVSHATAEILQQQFPRLDSHRLHVIHNGIIGAAPLQALPLPVAHEPWQLGFIGRLTDRKRPLDLVDVACRLVGKLEFVVHVFGDGPLLESLRTAIQSHRLESRFILHGYWDKGSAGMVAQFQVLVHTDREEPFGGALLEAQLGGRPVVAYAVGGNPEIVEHGVTGWLVPLGDMDGLVAGIQQLTGPRFADFSTAARQRATGSFLMAKMIDSYESLMESLCVRN